MWKAFKALWAKHIVADGDIARWEASESDILKQNAEILHDRIALLKRRKKRHSDLVEQLQGIQKRRLEIGC